MGCSFSGLNALYDNANGGGDVWINENRFRILRQASFPNVFLVKELISDPNKIKDHSHVSDDGTYAMKKVLIQNNEQLELVKEEIRVSSLFSHPNLLPLLDHAIISVKSMLLGLFRSRLVRVGSSKSSVSEDRTQASQDQSRKQEAYLLFPAHLDGTLLDSMKTMQAKQEFFSTLEVLQIFHQLCAGLTHMHNFDPPYAHNDVKPGNVLLTHRKGQAPLAKLMDFGNVHPARRQIRSRSEALQLQGECYHHHCINNIRMLLFLGSVTYRSQLTPF
ncbi:hypothetical protein H5410_061803 [Solanum commersonii]|uniref:Protein kinase domain-containing protein n=1 Tax=Solanum commersonii TaxID=4109 RepID=A0A9J5W8W9_SOLCO|nr:hypothetical protein H5410_061803 [Solanum commersonii]